MVIPAIVVIATIITTIVTTTTTIVVRQIIVMLRKKKIAAIAETMTASTNLTVGRISPAHSEVTETVIPARLVK